MIQKNIERLETKDDKERKGNLSAYIRAAKQDFDVLDVDWSDTYWEGVGYFVKQSHISKGSMKKVIPLDACFDSKFSDFAKAYVTEQHMINPGETRSAHIKRLQALRTLEASLLDLHGEANPLLTNLAVLDKAAELARRFFNTNTPNKIGRELMTLADVMVQLNILPAVCRVWTSPNKQVRNPNFGVDASSEVARQAKLPDEDALDALAEIFNRDLDPSDERFQRDIYTTSVTALLMCAPSRGQEIHRLPVNLTFEATDKFGDDQLGLRLHASKGFGAYVKWVWSEMVPVAEIAISRIRAATDEARSLARHLENPATCNRFYRHKCCPDVQDDVPLTKEQVATALGLKVTNAATILNKNGLSAIKGAYTLQTLWTEFVMPRHKELHPHFPYVSKKDKALGKKGGLKFSDALFCMLAHQMNSTKSTSPVTLWIPSLAIYNFEVGPSSTGINIFERYGYTDSNGSPLKLTSHQLRHLLNTEAQRSGLTDKQIARWSGRKDIGQNDVYDNRSVSERVEQARPAVEKVQASLTLPTNQSQDGTFVHGQWTIKLRPKPRSCSDIAEIQPHLTGLNTLYGGCNHDWAFAPCEGFIHCLDCNEHSCIKGGNEDAQTKLRRLEALRLQVAHEVTRAKLATADDADAMEWLQAQERYAAKIDELIAILKDPHVPDGSVIRITNGQPPTHTHRALRGLGVKALERGTESDKVMKEMLTSLDEGLKSDTSLALQYLPKLGKD